MDRKTDSNGHKLVRTEGVNEKCEAPEIHQPDVEDKPAPRVIRPSRTLTYFTSRKSKSC